MEVGKVQLEEYFDFLAPNDIRIKGTRVGIESILYGAIASSKPITSSSPAFAAS